MSNSKFASTVARLVSALALFIGLTSASHSQDIAIRSLLISTVGNPTSAIEARHGRYVFVSATNVGGPNFSGPDSAAGTRKEVVSGVQVFERVGFLGMHRSLHSIGFVRTGSTGANGLALLPGEKTLVVGVGDDGVAFIDVGSLIRGSAKPIFVSQGPRAGTFDVVATRDGKYVFSSNEYGVLEGQRGNVGVIKTNIDAEGKVTNPASIRQMPAGDIVPSIGLSPDGARLYVLSELVPANNSGPIAGEDDKRLTKADCVQVKTSPPRSNGLVTVLDVKRVVDSGASAVISRIAAGCSPVRVVEAADQSALYISARGDESILLFNPSEMESDPEHSLNRVLSSGGTAPVGLRLFAHDRWLAVANSDRFVNASGALSLIDLSSTAEDQFRDIVPAQLFPRNIALSIDGKTLYLTNYTSRTLESIRISVH